MRGTFEKTLSKTDPLLEKAVETSLEESEKCRRNNKVDRTAMTCEKILNVVSNGHLFVSLKNRNSENTVEKNVSISSKHDGKSQVFSLFIY